MADQIGKATPDDGGQAFPRAGFFGTYQDGSYESDSGNDGMTLRDYFAGQAMHGLISFDNGERLKHLFGDSGADDKQTAKEFFVQIAYELADAMVARSRKLKG